MEYLTGFRNTNLCWCLGGHFQGDLTEYSGCGWYHLTAKILAWIKKGKRKKWAEQQRWFLSPSLSPPSIPACLSASCDVKWLVRCVIFLLWYLSHCGRQDPQSSNLSKFSLAFIWLFFRYFAPWIRKITNTWDDYMKGRLVMWFVIRYVGRMWKKLEV